MAVLPLTDYLAIASRKRFDWENYNCGHFVSGWLKFAYGIEVRSDINCRLNGLKSLVAQLSGAQLAHSVDKIATAIGFGRVDDIQCGDIVLVQRYCMGLADPPFCVHITKHGMLFTQAEPDAIWRNRSAF